MTEILSLTLPATIRQERSKKVATLRMADLIPCVLYGHGVKNQELTVRYSDFEKIYKQAGGSSLVDLVIADHKPVKILIQDIQCDPVTGKFIHVDFHQVKMTEKINAEVELNFIGEPKAVKELGGILVKSLKTVKIECLPQDLIHEITVDITPLQTFEDMIRVKDLKVPAGVTLKEKDDEVVANVQPPRSEEELKSLEEKPEEKVEEVEKVEKEKEETEAEEATPTTGPEQKKS